MGWFCFYSCVGNWYSVFSLKMVRGRGYLNHELSLRAHEACGGLETVQLLSLYCPSIWWENPFQKSFEITESPSKWYCMSMSVAQQGNKYIIKIVVGNQIPVLFQFSWSFILEDIVNFLSKNSFKNQNTDCHILNIWIKISIDIICQMLSQPIIKQNIDFFFVNLGMS